MLVLKIGKDDQVVFNDIMETIKCTTESWKSYKCIKYNWDLAVNLGISTNVFAQD